jgi:hypothetical protein
MPTAPMSYFYDRLLQHVCPFGIEAHNSPYGIVAVYGHGY